MVQVEREYRFLELGEVTKEGDEFLCNDGWVKLLNVGYTIDKRSGKFYRREITNEDKQVEDYNKFKREIEDRLAGVDEDLDRFERDNEGLLEIVNDLSDKINKSIYTQNKKIEELGKDNVKSDTKVITIKDPDCYTCAFDCEFDQDSVRCKAKLFDYYLKASK
jgi:hypothetical protein